MSEFYQRVHALAAQLGAPLEDPPQVVEAHQRAAAFAELHAQPAPAPLADVLAGTQIKDWKKTVTAHAAAASEYAAIHGTSTRSFTRASAAAEHAAADTYLAQLAGKVRVAVEKATVAATHVTTTDHQVSVSRGEGLALHEVEIGVGAICAWAACLARVVPKISSDGGLAVWPELAVIDCGNIPVELRERDNLAHPTLNPEAERRHIERARRTLRNPRTALPEIVTGILVDGDDWLSLNVPATVAEAGQALDQWGRANLVRWA